LDGNGSLEDQAVMAFHPWYNIGRQSIVVSDYCVYMVVV
jgi:hypothetical protein